jgi:flagellar hook-associated protein 1 FlgK
MSLTSAINTAQSALANSAAQSALLSKNIANVSNANYSLETASTITLGSGEVETGPTQRAASAALLANLTSATSASASSTALDDGLEQIASSLGLDSTTSTSTTSATDTSPSTLIGAFSTALQAYENEPDQSSLGTAALTAATTLVNGLNTASDTVQSVREQADSQMADAVGTINSLLAQFQTVNTQIVTGTQTGADVSAAQDTRDGILKQLSSEIGITAVSQSNGGTAIYTDSGATLFNTTARSVTFTPTTSYTAGTTGNAVMVDGVPVTGSSAVMPIQSGALAGLSTLRDDTTVSYQNQLDQMASSLITTFAETSTGTPATTTNGLFTASGLTTPPTTSQTTGLAATLSINASFNPSAGGSVTALRDGASVSYNTTDAAAYSGRLQELTTALGATQSFNATSGGAASGTLASYAASSVSWLESARQSSSSSVTSTAATVSATTTALSNATGVNLDDQMSQMLDVEHAYQASAQLMNTVNTMYTALLQAFN